MASNLPPQQEHQSRIAAEDDEVQFVSCTPVKKPRLQLPQTPPPSELPAPCTGHSQCMAPRLQLSASSGPLFNNFQFPPAQPPSGSQPRRSSRAVSPRSVPQLSHLTSLQSSTPTLHGPSPLRYSVETDTVPGVDLNGAPFVAPRHALKERVAFDFRLRPETPAPKSIPFTMYSTGNLMTMPGYMPPPPRPAQDYPGSSFSTSQSPQNGRSGIAKPARQEQWNMTPSDTSSHGPESMIPLATRALGSMQTPAAPIQQLPQSYISTGVAYQSGPWNPHQQNQLRPALFGPQASSSSCNGNEFYPPGLHILAPAPFPQGSPPDICLTSAPYLLDKKKYSPHLLNDIGKAIDEIAGRHRIPPIEVVSCIISMSRSPIRCTSDKCCQGRKSSTSGQSDRTEATVSGSC